MQVQCLAEMREENSALLQRVAELDAKNDEQEKMLATVLSRNQGNGQHYGQAAPSLESGVRPHTPRSNETAMDGMLSPDFQFSISKHLAFAYSNISSLHALEKRLVSKLFSQTDFSQCMWASHRLCRILAKRTHISSCMIFPAL